MEQIIIYGAGNMGKAVCELLRDRCTVRGFIDGNLKMKGTAIMGFPVYHPSELADKQELLGLTVLVAMTVCPFSAMRQSLAIMGFSRIYSAGDYVAQKYAGSFILNTWRCSKLERNTDFADTRSDYDYDAAREWFVNRHDQDYDLSGNKYFPDFLWEKTSKCKVILDTGVLDGSFIDTFLKDASDRTAYGYTLTPATVALEELATRFDSTRVQLFAKEAAERDGMADYQRIGLMHPFVQTKTYHVKIERIDTTMSDIPFDFLRCYSMSEVLPILEGGKQSIQKYRPLIAANIGHYQSDFAEVPVYLRAICMNYRFYFRMHSYHGNDCILYAIPES